MTIEISLALTFISVAAALYFGISSKKRGDKGEAQEQAKTDAAIMVKLENIQTSMIEMKTEVKGFREEVQRVNEQAIRNEESLKSLHKRVDAMEKRLKIQPLD